MEKFYTLITGSSSGIGKAIAIECARRNMNLVLVSRPSPRLEQTASEIASHYNVEVEYLAADLTEHDAPLKVFEWCNNRNLKVNFLINNAGATGTIAFENNDPEYIDTIIMLNIRALVLLTRYFIPQLKECPVAKILNIGSISGYFPVPYKSVYAASKAFVYFFSRSISAELEDSGIRVFIVSPNGVDSNPRTTANINKHKLMGRLVKMSPGRFASLTLDKVERGKRVYIPRAANRFLFFISRLLPDNVIIRMTKKEFLKEL